MARYRLANPMITNAWLDTETGEYFVESDIAAWHRFAAWRDAGGIPDAAPPMFTPKPEDSRAGRIAKLAAQAKTGLADSSISSPGEKRMAAIFSQTLDALAALDPLPADPISVTIPTPPPPTPPTVPPLRVPDKPVRLQ